MVSMLSSSVVDSGFEPRTGQIKDYTIGICCFLWNDDEVRFVLDQHAELDFYSTSSLKQQSAGRHVAPLGHIIPIPSQPIFAHSFPVVEPIKSGYWKKRIILILENFI
jgi:hypothetical protein